MSDTIGEFLKACEYAAPSTVEQWRSALTSDPDNTAVVTQGAVMAARRHNWDVVKMLASEADVSAENFVVLRATASHKKWECFDLLVQQVNHNMIHTAVDVLNPSLFAADAGKALGQLLKRTTKSQNTSTALFSLAVHALRVGAFECMNAIEETSTALGGNLDYTLRSHANTNGFRQTPAATEFINSLNDFHNWKQKQILEAAIHPVLGSVGPRARKI